MKKSPNEISVSALYTPEGELSHEVVYDGEKSFFISLIHGEVKFQSSIMAGGATYVPPLTEALKKGAVILPRTAQPYGEIDDLINEIQDFIHKYLDVSPDYEVFASYYVLLTWVYDRLNTVPYLRFLGDFSTGKSRALNVIGGLCYKCIRTNGSVTVAPIFRLQSFWKGTLVSDEADRKRNDESDELVKVFNLGFEKNNPILRCDPNNPNDVEAHDPFGPKVIDQALESRCLTEVMRETSREDIPVVLPPKFYEQQEELRQKLLYFRLCERDQINPGLVTSVDLGLVVERRLRQAFSGFAVLLSNKPELLEKFRAFVLDYQRGLVEQRESTIDGAIVAYFFEKKDEVIGEVQSSISSSEILEALREKSGFSQMTAASVGRRLRALGINTKNVKVEGKVRRGVIWVKEDMDRLFRKYVSQSEGASTTTATTATPATKVAPVANVAEIAEAPRTLKCAQCGAVLENGDFIFRDDKPFCEGCVPPEVDKQVIEE